jgi:tetratricopeptide (TPR) repeat protein
MKKILVILVLWGWIGLNPVGAQTTSSPYDQGLAQYSRGQYKKALKSFQKALQLRGQRWRVLQALGDCWINLKDNEKALGYYRQSLKLHPDNPALDYLVSTFHPGLNPHLAVPNPKGSSLALRGIDLSFTWGRIYPAQGTVLGCAPVDPWQASFYFGLQPTPDWACGVQMDYIDFGIRSADSIAQANWTPGSSGPPSLNGLAPSLIAGNLSVNLKVYPFSATSPLPVYLLGGGGIFIAQRSTFVAYKYENFTSYYSIVPVVLRAGPSLNGGVGLALKVDEISRALFELRAVDVYLDQPMVYVSLNAGALFLF